MAVKTPYVIEYIQKEKQHIVDRKPFLQTVKELFNSLFLPVGYPESVTDDYLMFQICDTLQAMSSYLRGILSSRAVLQGVGVGKAEATATSAILHYVVRDLSGMLSSICFAWWAGEKFGSNVKQWRLFADVINDVGLTLELLAPAFPGLFLILVSVANICKALCGVAAGTTRIAILNHFAKNDNVTDLSSKEGIQEQFVTICGMLLGMKVTSLIGESGFETWCCFLFLMIIHVIANYYGVQALKLNTFNSERYYLVVKHWMENNEIATLEQIRQKESIIFSTFKNRWSLGLSSCNFKEKITNWIDLATKSSSSSQKFIILDSYHIFYSSECYSKDYLCSIYCLMAGRQACEATMTSELYQDFVGQFDLFYEQLVKSEWKHDPRPEALGIGKYRLGSWKKSE